MTTLPFFLQNIHFGLNLFAALVFFGIFWLFFDAWLGRRHVKDGLKVLGFLIICLSFVLHAATVEKSSLLIAQQISISQFAGVVRLVGYILLLVGIVADPLQPRPSIKNFQMVPFAGIAPLSLIPYALPILAVLNGLFFLRRATLGLEVHLRPISLGFFILAWSELFGLASEFRDTRNVALHNLVEPFGTLWIIEHVLLLLSLVVLARWVFHYLLKRIQTQVFFIFTTLILVLFLVITLAFTSVLFRHLTNAILADLSTNVQVLAYTIQSKTNETLADAEVIAENQAITSAVKENNRNALRDVTTAMLLAKKESSLLIVSQNGAVLMRGENTERFGDSLSDNAVVKRVLEGRKISTVMTIPGVMAPTVSVQSGVPIKDGDAVIGAVLVGSTIDNAFVDGIKRATRLDASIYAGNIRSATTFITADGESRWIGIKEDNPQILKTVLKEGKPYSGSVSILNVPYFASFIPLKDVDNNPIGMLFVGREQVTILAAGSDAIESTFLAAAVLLMLSIIPAFLIARYISRQVR